MKIEVNNLESIDIKTTYIGNDNNDIAVDYQIKVPDDILIGAVEVLNGMIRLDETSGNTLVHNLNGEIYINNIKGRIDILNNNGSINVTGETMIIKASTLNGNINADLYQISDAGAIFSTSNGTVNLHLSPGLNADLVIKTMNGVITSRSNAVVGRKIQDNYLDAKLGNGGPRIYTNVLCGNVYLESLKAG